MGLVEDLRMIKGLPRAERRAARDARVAAYLNTSPPSPPAPPPPPPPPEPVRQVTHGGQQYDLTAVDALTLFGALAMAVDGETARITLASGDVLDLTHEEVSDLGRQLAGTPADEVSG